MKTDRAGWTFVRNQQGFFTLALVTLALTAVIGGATILAMLTTRQPVSGAMDRLDRNEATPQDMNVLQNAGQDMARTARIAAAGGSLVGGGGPVPNPAGPGVLFPGEKALAGIIPRVIGRMTNQASQPAQTRDNPMPGETSGMGGRGSGSGAYNPLNDPNVTGTGRTGSAQNLDDVNRFGSDFQAQQTGGAPRSGQQPSGQQGQTVMQQPESYTTPGPYGRDTASSDQQGSGVYPPFGSPADRGGRGSDWTRWASEPERRPDSGGQQPGPSLPPKGQTTSPQPAGSKGIEVTQVGTAPAGKCIIVQGQLVPVQGYKENISGMTVTLAGPVNRSASSSAGGSFSFSEIPAGDYIISVNQWNYGMTKQSFTAPSGKSIKIVLKGSCPYLYVWDGSSYVKENDIYSVARITPSEILQTEGMLSADSDGLFLHQVSLDTIPAKLKKERPYSDYYKISNHAKPVDGNYRLKIVEQASEHSYTDFIELLALDHRSGTAASITRDGKTFQYQTLTSLEALTDLNGKAYSPEKVIDLYNAEGIEIQLPYKAFSSGILAVTWQGFLDGQGDGHTSATGRPSLSLQRKDSQGIWQTVDWVYPRDEVQQSFFFIDQKDAGWDKDGKVRLVASSCINEKFHRIQGIQWGHAITNDMTVSALTLVSALTSDSADVLKKVQSSDGESVHLGPGEEMSLVFKSRPLEEGLVRTLVFVTEGFYVPVPIIHFAGN